MNNVFLRTSENSPARQKHAMRHDLWDAIEGAVADCFRQHPEYLTEGGKRSAVESITKRAVGSVLSVFGAQERRRESGACAGAALTGPQKTPVRGDPAYGDLHTPHIPGLTGIGAGEQLLTRIHAAMIRCRWNEPTGMDEGKDSALNLEREVREWLGAKG